MGIAIVGFVFPHTLQSLLEESFTDKIIQTYREDPDLQNFIDFGQQKVKILINKHLLRYIIIINNILKIYIFMNSLDVVV